MSPAPALIASAATILAPRRRSGEQEARLLEWCRPSDVDTALTIQDAVTEALGNRIGAWKCVCRPRAVWSWRRRIGYWLTEFLRSKGQGLQAGQAVISGSCAGNFDLPVGQAITIRFGALGALTVGPAPR